ncbi:MAG: tetratricopeptide repeat protein [Muribaculaceae bacterium]|nr:tetratricopeptide repeat protein [Muribaculaceae bacterium]
MNINKRLMLMLTPALFFVSSLGAATLEEAQKAYTDGDFAQAAAIYEEVAAEKGVSAPLLTNMGNAYFKTGDYGHAMLCYRRALRIDPSDTQAKDNISYIESKVEDNNKAEAKGKKVSVAPEDRSFFSSVRRYIVYSHSSDSWALWAGSLFVLTCVCAALYIFASGVLVRKIGFFGGFIAFGFSLITLLFALVNASDRKKSVEGVVTAYKVQLLSEPHKDAKATVNPLTRGTVLNIQEEEQEPGDSLKWYRVRLNSDYSGWIDANDFQPI